MALATVFLVLIMYAFVPILIKFSEYEIKPNTVIFSRFWMGLPILGCWNWALSLKGKETEKKLSFKGFSQAGKKMLLLLVISGIFSGSHQLLYAYSLTQTSVANSNLLHSMTPVFTTFIAWVLLSQKFNRRYILGMTIAVGGSFALVANDFSITIDKLQGDGIALLSALLWSGYILTIEKLQTYFNVNLITFISSLVGTIFLLFILLVSGDDLFPYSWQVWIAMASLGSVGLFGSICLTYSLKRLSSGLVGTILLLDPIITAFLAWGIFSETFGLLSGLIFCVILFGVYLATSSEVQFSQSD
jgi:drug/metabolite transporter (DMT)-like permease